MSSTSLKGLVSTRSAPACRMRWWVGLSALAVNPRIGKPGAGGPVGESPGWPRNAVLARHLDVHQDQVEAGLGSPGCHGGVAVAGLEHPQRPCLRNWWAHDRPVDGVVLDHQHGLAGQGQRAPPNAGGAAAGDGGSGPPLNRRVAPAQRLPVGIRWRPTTRRSDRSRRACRRWATCGVVAGLQGDQQVRPARAVRRWTASRVGGAQPWRGSGTTSRSYEGSSVHRGGEPARSTASSRAHSATARPSRVQARTATDGPERPARSSATSARPPGWAGRPPIRAGGPLGGSSTGVGDGSSDGEGGSAVPR
jgi:hypothetical protein